MGRYLVFVVFLGVLVRPALGQFSWEVPYSGLDESPFHEFGIPNTLAVEDFEKGEITQPGFRLIPLTEPQYGSVSITTPILQSTANSVIEDTGDAATGHFLVGLPNICATIYPPLCPATVAIEFSEGESGLPTFVGFAWTDAVRTTNLDVQLPIAAARFYDAENRLLGVENVSGLPLRDDQNVAADDIFIGFLDHKGISRLEFQVVTDRLGGNLSMDHLQRGQAAMAGDTDLDGDVDFADFLRLADSFAGPGGWSVGDFTFDGLVGFEDFLKLSVNFGRTSTASQFMAAAVPEPALSLLSGFAIIAILRRRRRATTKIREERDKP